MKNKYWLIIATAMLIVVPSWGQETAQIIRAKMFILEDEQGRDRGAFWADSIGPKLIMFGESGLPCVTLSVKKNEPSLTLYDEKSDATLTLSVSKDGRGLLLRDERGEIRLELSLAALGPRIVMYDENGNVHIAMILDKTQPKVILQ